MMAGVKRIIRCTPYEDVMPFHLVAVLSDNDKIEVKSIKTDIDWRKQYEIHHQPAIPSAGLVQIAYRAL